MDFGPTYIRGRCAQNRQRDTSKKVRLDLDQPAPVAGASNWPYHLRGIPMNAQASAYLIDAW
ncbi:MAG: hypothetical protein ACREBP_11105, partial [Sphingomicrobium sp.]